MLDDKKKYILYNSLGFLGKLRPGEQDLVFSNTKNISYKKGENVHGGINTCSGLLLIKSGYLRSYILSEDGREVSLYLLESGDTCILSASCIINNINFDVHIDAEVDSEIILIDLDAVNKLSENIYVENFILNEAVARFSDVMWVMEQIARRLGSAREVVTRMLRYFTKENLVELSRGRVKIIDIDRLDKIANT